MENRERNERDRSQIGIWTLVVFVAMVVVTAVAAGVLINTIHLVQSESDRTDDERTSQGTDQLRIVNTVGENVRDGQINTVNVTVRLSPGASSVDLRNVTVQWIAAGGAYNLVHDRVESAQADGYFNVSAFKDGDGSTPVLNSPDDRFVMVFDLGPNGSGAIHGDGGSGEVFFESPIGESETVTLEVSTLEGQTVREELVAPQSLSGVSSVSL